MTIKTHAGHQYKTRSTPNGFAAYVFIGAPYWWRVHRGIVYKDRLWAERQAQWAIDDYVEHGKVSALSILPERRN